MQRDTKDLNWVYRIIILKRLSHSIPSSSSYISSGYANFPIEMIKLSQDSFMIQLINPYLWCLSSLESEI